MRLPLRAAALAIALTGIAVLSFSGVASAVSYNVNNIINDVVFDNTGTMSASQIDSFLNQFSGSCISTNNGFSTPDPIGYNPTNGYLYGGNVSAGQAIYDAGQAYGLNPQVILSTLQKEEGTVMGNGTYGCSTLAISAAVGYGCPDSGSLYSYSGVDLYSSHGVEVTSVSNTCVNTASKVGFSQQIIHAAWLFKFGEQRSEGNINWAVIKGNWDNSDDPQSCYGGPMTQGTWQVCPGGASAYYDGYDTIDSTSVHMDNGATAALYWYTPHFSSFYDIFTGWFGSTYTNSTAYYWNLENQQAYADSAYSRPFTDGISIAPGQKAYFRVQARNFGYQTWDPSVVHLGTSHPENCSSVFADASWLSSARIQMQQTTGISPGSDATFQFSVTAPSTPGTYREYFNVVADGITWLNDPGLYYSIDVVAPQQPTNSLATGLTSGQSIAVNQHLLSPDTQSTLNLQSDGNLVEYEDFKPVWATYTIKPGAAQLVMQTDGNLVEYSSGGTALWASGTNNNPGAYLSLQTDGNLVIYSSADAALWSTGKLSVQNHLDRVNESLPAGNLYPGQTLETADRGHELALQPDGNLVLYNAAGKALWASNTNGQSVANLAMQGDGNLVLYGTNGKALWSSNTIANVDSSLFLQSDGVLALHQAGGGVLWQNTNLYPNQTLETADRGHDLALQPDGNLVLYNAAGKALWASNTNGQSVANLAMQGDGNLVLYGTNGKALWSSGTQGVGPSHIAAQQDGNLVVYNALNQAVWSTGTGGN